MITNKLLIFSLIVLLIAYPASAGEVTLNRWVLNVIIHEDGTVEEIIQTEIENGGSSLLDGFSFFVPSARISKPNVSSFSQGGQSVELKTVTDGTQVNINFDTGLETGKKWDGRIDFNAENWAVKEGQDYSINVAVEAPQAIISGKSSKMNIPAEPEIRSQVFLPKSVNPTSVEPSVDTATKKPAYKKLLQYNKFEGEVTGADLIVLTWFQLKIGDIIKIKGTYSGDLDKIVEVNGKTRSLSDRIKVAKEQGRAVSEAESHLSNARAYSNQALDEFWEKKDVSASIDAANNEINLAEKSLSAGNAVPGRTGQTPESKKTPGPGIIYIISIMFIIHLLKRKNRQF